MFESSVVNNFNVKKKTRIFLNPVTQINCILERAVHCSVTHFRTEASALWSFTLVCQAIWFSNSREPASRAISLRNIIWPPLSALFSLALVSLLAHLGFLLYLGDFSHSPACCKVAGSINCTVGLSSLVLLHEYIMIKNFIFNFVSFQLSFFMEARSMYIV